MDYILKLFEEKEEEKIPQVYHLLQSTLNNHGILHHHLKLLLLMLVDLYNLSHLHLIYNHLLDLVRIREVGIRNKGLDNRRGMMKVILWGCFRS